MKTTVISAFPACGKTYAFENFQNEYSILDSDSSKFDKKYFPDNYINHIKENIGKVDIIFVSSHQPVREALTANNIEYITVYPEINCGITWLKRMINRGNDDKFLRLIINNWDEWVYEVKPHGKHLIRLGNDEYMDLEILKWIVTL